MKNMMSPRTFAWSGCWWLGCLWIATAVPAASLWGQESHDFQQQLQLLEQKLTEQFETQLKKLENDQQSVQRQLDAWKNKTRAELEVWIRDSNQKLATWTETHGAELQQYLQSNSSNINRWIANAEQEIARTVRQLEKKIDQVLKPQPAPSWEVDKGADGQFNPLIQRAKSDESSSAQPQKMLSASEAEGGTEGGTEVSIRNAIQEELTRHRVAMATLQSQLRQTVQARAAAQQEQWLKEQLPKAPSAAGLTHSDPSPQPAKIIQPVQAAEQPVKPHEIERLRKEIKQLREELDQLKKLK